MKHGTSYRARRIVGRLDPGEEIVETLTALCERETITAGSCVVTGRLRAAELLHLAVEERQYVLAHDIESILDIAMMRGNVATLGGQVVLKLEAMLTASGPFGAQFVSGQVRSATVEQCEFVVEIYEDMILERSMNPKTGELVLYEIEADGPPSEPTPVTQAASPAQATQPAAAPASSWAAAIEASEDASTSSKRREKPAPKSPPRPAPQEVLDLGFDDEDELPEMKPGDILDHPKLGRCRIMRVDEDEYAHIRLPRGRISKLVLDLFDISVAGEEDGKRVFKLRLR
ncbi:MAG: DUF296 domain-containing protein [Myxococcota bacterium]